MDVSITLQFGNDNQLTSAKRNEEFNMETGANIQGVPGGKVNILGGHSIGHCKQKCLYEHVSYSERFTR